MSMNQIATIDERLVPAVAADIGACLSDMWEVLPLHAGDDPKRRLAGYLLALNGNPLWAIQETARRFIRGEVKGQSTRWSPHPPELAQVARGLVDEYRAEQQYQKPPPKAERAYSPDGAERARMRLKMPMLHRAFGNASLMSELAAANEAGMEAMVLLAGRWGIPVPAELLSQTDEDWHRARRLAWSEIERNPPPFLRNR